MPIIDRYTKAYLIGIGGSGISTLARWFNQQGMQVWGYDRASTKLTDQLCREGIGIHFTEDPADIPAAILHNKAQTLVVYSPAIPKQQALRQYLHEQGYACYKRAEILGMITQQYFTVAIAGTHGKTTTSGLMAHILITAGKNVTAFLGGIAKGYDTNLLISGAEDKDRIVVIEADEFDHFFLHLHPNIAIITTVDPDHLDIYQDQVGFEKGFCDFVRRVPADGEVIVQQAARQRLLSHGPMRHMREYAQAGSPINAANIRIDQGQFCFYYVGESVTIRDITLPVPGYHQLENALGVITACLAMGLSPAAIRHGIHTFAGMQRRFDYVIRHPDLIFLDDYGHHPVEIEALLRTLRQVHPGKSITVVFRPNLYTRTRDFADEFAQSLSLADHVFLLDIYPDREEPIEGVCATSIFEKIALQDKHLCTTQDVLEQLAAQGKPEVIVALGSGGVSPWVPTIKAWLLKLLQEQD